MAPDIAAYLESVGDAHRKAWGQFFTPPQVANFMVQWVLQSGIKGIHDPGFGLGAFLDATHGKAGEAFTGSEVDPRILDHWKAHAPESASAVVRREDYLLSWGNKFGNIVCNPPYMRFQKFLNRKVVFRDFEERLNVRLSGYINTASAFLLKSLSELRPSGRLAYIMPLEFLNTGYGKLVKERLIADSHLAVIISLDCERDVFPDAITSVGIILYDSARKFSHIKFFKAKSIESLGAILDSKPISEVPYGQLQPDDNWFLHLNANPVIIDRAKTVPLSYYGRFSRGIATGANKFFALKPSRAKELGLADSEVVPSITKSAQVNAPFFTDGDYEELVKRDEPVLLFNVNGRISENATAYIRYGELKGFNQRFITKHRTPWYKTEKRNPSPLLLGVFSRGGYKVVRNKADVLNLTCFHGFQPNIWGRKYIDHLFLYFHSATGREITSLSMRRYGDALDKFEPNDLNKASVPNPQIFDEIPSEHVRVALEQLEGSGTIPRFVESRFENLKSV